MHLGTPNTKSKSEAMYFPPSLTQAKEDFKNNILPEDVYLSGNKKIHFVNKFKYLSSIITPLLNENLEVETRIQKLNLLWEQQDISSIIRTSTNGSNHKFTSQTPKCPPLGMHIVEPH